MSKQNILISIILAVKDPQLSYLKATIDSVRKQDYKNWQLCIVSNGTKQKKIIDYLDSIKSNNINILFLKEKIKNGKALNKALAMTKGSHVALIDNSDLLAKHALRKIIKAINSEQPDLIYSDENALNIDGKYINPHFKPSYSPDTILSYNYIGHLIVISKKILTAIKGFDERYEFSMDYDLLLRCLEITQKIKHIPEILYHSRVHLNTEPDAFKDLTSVFNEEINLLQDACDRRGIKASVLPGIHTGTYRVKRLIQGQPSVSIIIPFRDNQELLRRCLDSILEKTTYKNFNIIGINNDSIEESTKLLMKEYQHKDKRIKFYKQSGPFNFSRINNCAVRLTEAEHIILLNNDMEVISSEWIESLLEHSQRPEVGAVGAKLYFPDGRIQHTGVIIGIKGAAGHAHKYLSHHHSGYFYRSQIILNVSSVTAACLMVKRRLYLELGGLNEEHLPIAFNDADFCLRLAEQGYLNIFTPFCELYHYEAATRGHLLTPKLLKQLMNDMKYFKDRHKKVLKTGDRYYNPNLPLHTECFGLLTGKTRLIQPKGSNISF